MVDGSSLILTPGFIDSHVHVLGGGGEGGFANRTPEATLEGLTKFGVTTVVGCLGTDGIGRDMCSLVAKTKGLNEQGMSAYCYTGSYQIPVHTLTDSIKMCIRDRFLDMSGTSMIYPDPLKTAFEIKDKIRNELGFTVNIGISTNKLLAKMASDFEKPDKVHTLFPDEIPIKMWPLPVRDLLFLGKASEKRLTEAGIHTIGDMAHSSEEEIQRLLAVSYTHLDSRIWIGSLPK